MEKESNGIDLPKMLSNIDSIILSIKEEVEMFAEIVDIMEAKYGKAKEAAEISTTLPFLDLSMFDILILHKLYLSTNDPIEKNFVCRTAAHHMYEFLEDGSRALGKQLNVITVHLINTEINTNLTKIRKTFNELKAKLHTSLKELRHNVSGHKDRDIRTQLAISKAINLVDFQLNFLSFLFFFVDLHHFKRLIIHVIKKQDSFTDI